MKLKLSENFKWAMICMTGITWASCAENTPEESPSSTTKAFKLSKAEDCADLQSQIVDSLLEQAIDGKYNQPRTDPNLNNTTGQNNPNPNPNPNTSTRVDGGPPEEFTTTNTQEAGVDEPDFVKTDGGHIYALQDNELIILKAQPANETAVVGRLAISGSSSTSMFLRDDRIAVISDVYNEECHKEPNVNSSPGENPTEPVSCSESDLFVGTRVTIVDISDRSAPTVLRSLDIGSTYASARMIGSDVYVVSQDQDLIPQEYRAVVSSADSSLIEVDWQSTEQEVEAARQHARPILRAQLDAFVSSRGVQSFLPRTRSVSVNGGAGALSDLYACEDVYLPAQATALGILNITHIDMEDDASAITSTGLLAGGSTVYASQETLYVALSSRTWWWGNGITENTSHIHKFVLDDPNKKARYAASGVVDGWLLNQFSLSEHDGHLRIATSDSKFVWNAQTQTSEQGGNHLIILREENGELVETGAIRGFAKGKEMDSARLLGDNGFVATLNETDPLFTFNLSDPNDPKLEGELSINGSLGYMHPMGANHLLTLGHETDRGGVQLQIFDVADLKVPTLAHQLVMSTGKRSSYSKAIEDHRAFTFDPLKEILAIPFDSEVFVEGELPFRGLVVIRANETGITELGRVTHGDILPEPVGADDDFQWASDLRRSIFIDDFVFSISDLGVKVNELEDPAVEVARVAFNP